MIFFLWFVGVDPTVHLLCDQLNIPINLLWTSKSTNSAQWCSVLNFFGNLSCLVSKAGIQNYINFWLKITILKRNYPISRLLHIWFLTLLAKGLSTKASDFPFINSLKILGCATNRDELLFSLCDVIRQNIIKIHLCAG